MIESLTLTKDAQALKIGSNDGSSVNLSAIALRRAARDAQSRRARIDSNTTQIPANLAITRLIQMGSTGINIHFSDGHTKAIYPYSYLAELIQSIDN